MAQVTRESPYTAPGEGVDGTDPDLLAGLPAYAVPDSLDTARDPRYGWDNSGQAQPIDVSTTGTPDASRLRRTTLFETRPGEGDPVSWWSRFTRDLFTSN